MIEFQAFLGGTLMLAVLVAIVVVIIDWLDR